MKDHIFLFHNNTRISASNTNVDFIEYFHNSLIPSVKYIFFPRRKKKGLKYPECVLGGTVNQSSIETPNVIKMGTTLFKQGDESECGNAKLSGNIQLYAASNSIRIIN